MEKPILSLTVLGSGSYAPAFGGKTPVRNPAGYAVEIEGRIVLFDFGFGNLRALAKAGLDIRNISHVFLTHFHLDHWGDLPSLLFLFHYDFKPVSGKLTITGPPGIKKFLKKLMAACRPYTDPAGYRLCITELADRQTRRYGRFLVKAKAVRHSEPSFSYRMETGGKTVTYTGDSSFEDSLVRFAMDSDLLIAESSLPGPATAYGHMTVDEALTLARLSHSKKTLLSHISPQAEPAVLKKTARLSPMILPAGDGMRILL
ncbi:MAG: MBL fold metallo-hydrolase [bacterium]